MIVLLSFERYMVLCKKKTLTRRRTIADMAIVLIFAILYNVPNFFIWRLESRNGRNIIRYTELFCDSTFQAVYIHGLNACFRFLLPTIGLMIFNFYIYKEVEITLGSQRYDYSQKVRTLPAVYCIKRVITALRLFPFHS